MKNKITQKDIENAIYLSEQYQKSIEEKPQPLFTLTAEETDRFVVLLNKDYYQCQDLLIKNCDILEESDKTRLRDEMRKDAEILNRIYKWQDDTYKATKEDY